MPKVIEMHSDWLLGLSDADNGMPGKIPETEKEEKRHEKHYCNPEWNWQHAD